jgi:glycosyltransferase involved in cell wall biosynthesis
VVLHRLRPGVFAQRKHVTAAVKILQLISSGGPYGAEAVVKNLAVYLKRLGCDSQVGLFLNSRNPHLELAESLSREGVSVEVFQCRGRFDLHTLRSIRSYIRSEQIDICHTHGYKADLFGMAATRGLGTAVMTTRHMSVDEHELGAALRLYCVADKIAARYFGKVVAVSDPIATTLRRWGVPRNKLSLVTNGADLTAFEGAAPKVGPRTGKVVGFVGRLTEQKGVFELVEAVNRILRGFPEVKLVMVGEGPDRQRLETRIAALGMEHSVELLGALAQSEMPSAYASFDIVALPSYNEGLPMSLLEAMASGCAVVASRVGAIPSVIEHEQSGLLVEPRNVEELAGQVGWLLANPGRRAELAQRGRTVVRDQFSARAMADGYLALYEELVPKC